MSANPAKPNLNPEDRLPNECEPWGTPRSRRRWAWILFPVAAVLVIWILS